MRLLCAYYAPTMRLRKGAAEATGGATPPPLKYSCREAASSPLGARVSSKFVFHSGAGYPLQVTTRGAGPSVGNDHRARRAHGKYYYSLGRRPAGGPHRRPRARGSRRNSN